MIAEEGEAAGRVCEETKRVHDKLNVARDKLPVITVREGDTIKIVGEIESALHTAGVPVFERGGAIVYPHKETFDAGQGRKTVAATLKQYTPEALLLDAGRSATFIKWKKGKDGVQTPYEVDAPGNQVRLLMNNSRHWKVRPVVSVATTPIMRADGSIIGGDKPLYDAASRLYYVPGVHVRDIDESPSMDDAAKALAWLWDQLLAEFPFASDVDRAVALSALMTPLVRASMDVAPMHMVRASTAGSGKSYLVETASMIATGELPPIVSVSPDDEEMRKHLSALIMRGAPIFSLDNASDDVGGNFLCQILAQGRVSPRILGKSEAPDLECRASVFCTGNNVGVRGDMVRRVLFCNLDPQVERPELRQFSGNPVETARANRGEFIAAILTIIRAYIRAGAPKVCDQVATYDGWTRMVRSPLVWLAHADPAELMAQARADDPELTALSEFLAMCPMAFGRGVEFKAREIIARAENEEDMRELLERIGCTDTLKLGHWLKRNKGRVVEGRRLVASKHKARGGAVRYSVEHVKGEL